MSDKVVKSQAQSSQASSIDEQHMNDKLKLPEFRPRRAPIVGNVQAVKGHERRRPIISIEAFTNQIKEADNQSNEIARELAEIWLKCFQDQ